MAKIDELLKELCPDGVEYVSLESILEYEQPGKYIVKNTEYNDLYTVPVLTAGKSFLLGYTNETSGVYEASSTKPTIIFDDFITSFHWVDFPCKVKSSALKFIRPKNNDNVCFRYVYYQMCTINFVAKEHVRHWISVYSKFAIPLPPVPIQQYIVEVLDTFTDAIGNLEEELALREKQFEYYREQLFNFDDENYGGKQLCSDRVEWKTLGEIGSIVRGKRFCHRDAVDVGIPCIHYGEIYTYYGTKANVTKSFVDESLASKLRFAKKGDVVIVGAGENDLDIGIGVAYLGDDLVAVHDACYTLSNHNMNPLFISYWLRTNKYHQQIRMYVSSAKICSLSNEGLKKAFIPVPSLSVQQEIVEILDTFEAMIANIKEEIALRTKQYEYYREKLLSFGK